MRRSLVDDDSSKVTVVALMRELKSFPVWQGSTKLSADEALDRDVLTSVSSWFHADGTPQEISNYYESLAKARGWTPKKRTSDRQERFCKDRVSLVIRAEPQNGGVDYVLDLTWTNQVRSERYC
ncbi:hypothetical protein [Lysobacter enzymogenes]|uniref:hypothetical protein n=1 Tax=Lysobacter enzymogenes TaxID=69 RepID=UPI001A957DF1|nr:hypothetical protein [Lysobacter enzymogenes]QQP94376.1 hypothetical protein JHW38_13965 [Lysobacter enzymogenes]